MKIKTIIFILLILVLISGYVYQKKYITKNNAEISSAPVIVNQNNSPNKTSSDIIDSKNSQSQSISIPSSYNIKNVPFQSQAPFANWDHLHEEACEEASLIIVKYYLDHQPLSAQEMENNIQTLISWEQKNWGKSDADLTIAQEKTLAQNYYNLNPEIKTINSIDDIKQEIAAEHIVIVPAAGQMLHNPNYTAPGPVYHTLVVRGYTSNIIITNDVGTRRGENYSYQNDIFWNALHDWNGTASNITSGQKVILVF